jgi:hypothetical protein
MVLERQAFLSKLFFMLAHMVLWRKFALTRAGQIGLLLGNYCSNSNVVVKEI